MGLGLLPKMLISLCNVANILSQSEMWRMVHTSTEYVVVMKHKEHTVQNHTMYASGGGSRGGAR